MQDSNDDIDNLAATIPAAADRSRANPSPLREAFMGPGSVANSRLDESEVPAKPLEVCRIANQALGTPFNKSSFKALLFTGRPGFCVLGYPCSVSCSVSYMCECASVSIPSSVRMCSMHASMCL